MSPDKFFATLARLVEYLHDPDDFLMHLATLIHAMIYFQDIDADIFNNFVCYVEKEKQKMELSC